MSEKKKIDERTLEALLELSRLSPASSNLDVLRAQVEQIVTYFDVLSEFDRGENPYDAYPSTVSGQLRQDDMVSGLAMGDVKKITGEFTDGYFRVPKVLGEGV